MMVRCGRCRVELEVSGAGEFACPNCGTRNVVRGSDPLAGVPDLAAPAQGGGLVGISPSPPAQDAPPQGVGWIVCPSCSYRFAVGPVDEVGCPTCGTPITVDEVLPSEADGS